MEYLEEEVYKGSHWHMWVLCEDLSLHSTKIVGGGIEGGIEVSVQFCKNGDLLWSSEWKSINKEKTLCLAQQLSEMENQFKYLDKEDVAKFRRMAKTLIYRGENLKGEEE